jgi:hypothetical protein
LKANYVEFETKLSMDDVGNIFREAVQRRPLRLKVARFKFFAPEKSENPFEAIDGSVTPDFEVGAGFQFPGPDPAMGTIILGCLRQEVGTIVSLRSTGNMRGRMFTNKMMGHILDMLHSKDPEIDPQAFSGRL